MIRPKEGTSELNPTPKNDKNTSYEMKLGRVRDTSVTITEIR